MENNNWMWLFLGLFIGIVIGMIIMRILDFQSALTILEIIDKIEVGNVDVVFNETKAIDYMNESGMFE